MYCQRSDLNDYVLEAYLSKAEELNPGCADRHLATVEEEIDGALLQGGYALPLERVPGKLRHIAAVLAAYRTVSGITSLMQESGTAGNEFLGLQTQHKQTLKDLEDIRSGNLDLFPSSAPEPVSERIDVKAPPRIFGDDTWGKF